MLDFRDINLENCGEKNMHDLHFIYLPYPNCATKNQSLCHCNFILLHFQISDYSFLFSPIKRFVKGICPTPRGGFTVIVC